MDPRLKFENPYAQGTPQWLLYEQITSAELAAITYDQDAQRFTRKAAEQRERARLYRAALDAVNDATNA